MVTVILSPKSVVVKLNVAVPPLPIDGCPVIVIAVPDRASANDAAILSWLLANPLAMVGEIAK